MLLDGLLGILPLGRLLEGLGRYGSLQRLELESVTGGEEVGVVDALQVANSRLVNHASHRGPTAVMLTLMKGLILDRLAIRLAPIDLVTFKGYFSIPATMAWG